MDLDQVEPDFRTCLEFEKVENPSRAQQQQQKASNNRAPTKRTTPRYPADLLCRVTAISDLEDCGDPRMSICRVLRYVFVE